MSNTDNRVTLLVKLGVDTSNKDELQREVDKLAATLTGLKVNITINDKAIAALEKLSNMDFTKISTGAKKANEEVEKGTVKTAQQIEKAYIEASKRTSGAFDKMIDSGKFLKTTSEIQSELKKLGQDVKVTFDVKDGVTNLKAVTASYLKDGITTTIKFKQDTMIGNQKFWTPSEITDNDKSNSIANKQLDELNKKVRALYTQGKITEQQYKDMNKSISELGDNPAKNVDKFNATLDRMIKKTAEMKTTQKNIQDFVNHLDQLLHKGKITSTQFEQMVGSINKVKTPAGLIQLGQQLNQMAKGNIMGTDLAAKIEKTTTSMEKLLSRGKLTQEQFNRLNAEIAKVYIPAQMKDVNTKLGGFVEDNRKQAQALKEVQVEQRRVNDNDLKRKNLLLEIERAMKQQPKTLNQDAAKDLFKTVARLNPESQKFSENLKRNALELKKLKVAATESSRANTSLMESFKIAMQKFPIWMAASTIFFSSIRTAREFVRIIVDIDTKMTSLAKVMNEDTNLATIFEQATVSAEKFGQTLSQVLDSYAEFARQGWEGDDLEILAEAGLIAANVGEITAQNASELLTASLVQWKLEAKDAMGVIDSFNAISNNYATTLEKLGRGQARSGATARAMGMSFDQLNGVIGTVTAATKQSGDEVGNFVKNVLPRLVGKPAQDALASLNISLADGDGNMRDVIEVYTEVANKIKGVSDVQRVAVVEGLAGKFHISRMQALLDDLGSVDSMYRSIYETSVNSAGSAATENEKYMGSLQARINLARVEVEKLAVAMGEAFVSEGLITFLKVFGSGMKAVTELTKVIGALPIVLGVLAVTLALVSTRIRAFGAALAIKAKAMMAADVHARKLDMTTRKLTMAIARQNAMVDKGALTMGRYRLGVDKATLSARKLAVATGVLSTAFRALGSALLFGAAFVAIGLLIEGVTKLIGKNRELKESAETANRELVDSYKNNSLEVEALLGKYTDLEKAMAIDPNNLETLEKYKNVQDELGNLMPSLITGEDEYGRKIIDSSANIATKIEMLKEQIRLEKDLAEVNAREDRKENIEGNKEIVKDAEKSAKKELKNLTNGLNNINALSFKFEMKFEDDRGKPLINSLEDIATYVDIINKKRKEALASGDDKLVKYYDKLRDRLQQSSSAMIGYDALVNSTLNSSKNLYAETVADMIDSQMHLDSYTKTSFTEMTNKLFQFVDAAKAGKLEETLSNIIGDADLSSDLAKVTKGFQDLNKATDENFDEIASKLKASISAIKPILKDAGLKPQEVNQIVDGFSKIYDNIIKEREAVAEIMKENPKINLEDAVAQLKAVTDETNELADAAEDAAEAFDKLIDSISFINGVLEDYEEHNYLTASSLLEIIDKYPQLMMYMNDEARLIEELTKLRDNEIDLAKQALITKLDNNEEYFKANQQQLQALINQEIKFYNEKGRLYQVDLNNFTDLAQAKADVETKLIQGLADKWEIYYSKTADSFYVDSHDRAAKGKFVNEANQRLADSRNLFKNFSVGKIDVDFKSLGTSLDSYSKSKDKDNKKTKESIYITDKFKQALEALNLEIEKQQKLRTKMTDYSKAYRDSLAKEIKLEKQKLTLLRNQLASLKKQVATGKINQTGTVSGGTTTSTSSSRKLSGWNGRRTSNYGYRNFQGKTQWHGGIDMAMAKGTRLDANVGGKVIASGNAAKNGYHSSYGNIVVVQDANGMKHLYAHLDKAIAKLGSTIVKGTQIGTIGSTGNSTGPHLHYEVRNKKGQTINPASLIAAAQKLVITTKASTKTVSGTQQAIDEAKSTIISLESDILAALEKIEQLEMDIINSNLENYNQKRDALDRTIGFIEERTVKLDNTGSQYVASQYEIIKAMKQKQVVDKEELAYLEGLIKSGKLSANVLAEMKINVANLKIEVLALANSIHEVSNRIVQAKMDKYSEKIDDLQHLIDRSRLISNLMAEGTEEYNREVNYQIDLLKKQQNEIANQRKALLELLKTEELSVEQRKEYLELAEDLSESYWELENSIVDTTKALEESNKAILEDAADKLIDAYKEYLSEKQEMHMKALDDEMDAEDKRHKKIMDNYKKELDDFRKLVQDKIDLIDKEESEANYGKEMDKLEEERLKILEKINLISIDDSFEAKAERKRLQEELAEIDESIADKRHQKEIEDRKESLNDLVKKKEEEIELKEKAEDERHESEKERIDKLKEYWNQFYEDQLNDERKFEEIRQQIILGNFDKLSDEFNGFLKEMKDTMPSLENTLDGTMKAVGTSIRKNVVDNIQEAIDLLEKVEKDQKAFGDAHGGSKYVDNSFAVGKGLDVGDEEFLVGKLIESQMINLPGNKTEASKTALKTKANNLSKQGKTKGSKFNINTTFDDALKTLTTQQKIEFGKYLMDNSKKLFPEKHLQDYVYSYGKKIAGLNTGGYTGKFDGGKLGILHEQEVVLDKKETKDFFKYAPILEKLNQLINPIKLPMIKQPTPASDSSITPISITFEVEKMIANESTAKNLAKTVLSEVNNTLKRERGIR